MIKTKVSFKITFPACGHTLKGYRAENETSEEEVKDYILKKFEGYCGECYEKYCEEKGVKPWWKK